MMLFFQMNIQAYILEIFIKTILDAEDYRSGALTNVDLLIQPGGSCKGQYEALGTNGVEALRRYVLEGGHYYGVCAGAFMGAQISRPEWPRLGLVPFKGDDPEHYRGSAPIKVALTEEGKKAFIEKSQSCYDKFRELIGDDELFDATAKFTGRA